MLVDAVEVGAMYRGMTNHELKSALAEMVIGAIARARVTT